MVAPQPGPAPDGGLPYADEVNREVARIVAETPRRLPEERGRCRVCTDPEARARVNRLLAWGMDLREIESLLGDINARRRRNNQITYYSLRGHKERHFNIQDPASAALRRILERRKAQVADETATGVGNLLTGMAYLDIVAQKGFQNLLDEDTVVDYETGLKAQLKLEDMVREGAIEEQVAQMRRDVSVLQQAVRDVLGDKPALLTELSQRIDELTGNSRDEVITAEVIDDDDEDDDVGYDPEPSADANDMLGED